MPSTDSLPRVSPGIATEQAQRIRHLPVEARDAFLRFEATGGAEALNTVILAIIGDFSPQRGGEPLESAPGTTRLIEDLGFDSLAITEVVFFIEDLFGITISNQEIVLVRTLDDLRSFVRRKIPAPVATC